MKPGSPKAPLVALLAGAIIISTTAIFARLTSTGPAAAGFWRLALALPLLAFLAVAARARAGLRTPPPRPPRDRLLPLVLAACAATFAADLGFWHYSLRLTSVANSTVLANMTPVVVTVLAWLAFRERPSRGFLAGLALAVGGAVVMTLARASGGAGTDPAAGDALAIVTTVWYALYFLSVRRARESVGALTVMLATSVVGAPLLLLVATLLKERIWPVTIAGWEACAALGLVHVGGQGLLAWALGKVPTALAAVVVLVQPVAAALLSWAVFAEAVTPVQALGGLLALIGVAVAQAAARGATPPGAGEAEGLAAP